MSDLDDDGKAIPMADSVQWLGLCPCGCGSYKVVLLDEEDKPLAVAGWDREGWIRFMDGVLSKIGVE